MSLGLRWYTRTHSGSGGGRSWRCGTGGAGGRCSLHVGGVAEDLHDAALSLVLGLELHRGRLASRRLIHGRLTTWQHEATRGHWGELISLLFKTISYFLNLYFNYFIYFQKLFYTFWNYFFLYFLQLIFLILQTRKMHTIVYCRQFIISSEFFNYCYISWLYIHVLCLDFHDSTQNKLYVDILFQVIQVL